MHQVDIGVFVHNEEKNITRMIHELSEQDILKDKHFSVRVTLLANGCNDNSVPIAINIIEKLGLNETLQVLNFEEGGKSRTWNKFVHEVSRKDTDYLIFADCDIYFTRSDVLSALVGKLESDSELKAASSQPVKDLAITEQHLSLLDKIILSSGGALNDWRHSICGQLYITKAIVAKSIYMPIGLPVEDGYMRAMILTDGLKAEEDITKIDGDENIFHVYESERTIGALIKHQSRIVIGSAINAVIYKHLRSFKASERQEILKHASMDELWLQALIKSELPTWPYAWVPFSFLTKRLCRALEQPMHINTPKKIITLLFGLIFDAMVYFLSQYKMARGSGVGYW